MSKNLANQQSDDLQAHEQKGNVSRAVIEALGEGRFPVKLVTGSQETTGLNFDLKPGAIVAHPGSAVIFVCG